MSLQVSIANQNSLPIESATLVVEYPKGTQSVSEIGKEIYTDRQQLNNITTGQVVNVPIKARMFGEENEEKIVKVAIEYRIAGSNATFYKEAEPFRFKISTSPLVLSIDGVKSISSGQEIALNVTVQSNSPTPLTNILIKGTYPDGFDFSESDPENVSGHDTWRISTLDPGEKKTITLKGILVGRENDLKPFSFAAGVSNERDAFNLASTLTTFSSDVRIEKPFLEVGVLINGEPTDVVVADSLASAPVDISFKNVLDSTIYNGTITVELEGNALSKMDVNVPDGYFDSAKNTITWDSVGVPSLKDVAPGQTSKVSFVLTPRTDVAETPEIKLKVTVEGKRVFEDRPSEQVVGTAARTLKLASVAVLTSSALYTEGPFVNSGPIPPVAEKTTQYTLLLSVQNGTNAITGAEVTAILPQYITWLDLVSKDDTVTYTSTTRTLKWNIGNMDAGAHEEVWMQVSFTPSQSQVGNTPTILETQRFKATDRFTGTLVRTEAASLSTELFNDPDQSKQDGEVQKAN
jgi:hypothetical protein